MQRSSVLPTTELRAKAVAAFASIAVPLTPSEQRDAKRANTPMIRIASSTRAWDYDAATAQRTARATANEVNRNTLGPHMAKNHNVLRMEPPWLRSVYAMPVLADVQIWIKSDLVVTELMRAPATVTRAVRAALEAVRAERTEVHDDHRIPADARYVTLANLVVLATVADDPEALQAQDRVRSAFADLAGAFLGERSMTMGTKARNDWVSGEYAIDGVRRGRALFRTLHWRVSAGGTHYLALQEGGAGMPPTVTTGAGRRLMHHEVCRGQKRRMDSGANDVGLYAARRAAMHAMRLGVDPSHML